MCLREVPGTEVVQPLPCLSCAGVGALRSSVCLGTAYELHSTGNMLLGREEGEKTES